MRIAFALAALVLALPLTAFQKPAAKAPSARSKPAEAPAAESETEERELSDALRDAGSSPVEFVRALEAFLAKYPKTSRREDIERALAKASVETKDERRVALYGERVLAKEPDDMQMIDRTARALLVTGDQKAAERALGYARHGGTLIAAMRSEKPPGKTSQARWEDEVDRALARSLALQARCARVMGRNGEAAELARKSFETYPTAEGAREAARALAAQDKAADAVTWFARAFAIPDSRSTESDRAADRAQAGALYARAHSGETGLGDILLGAYDYTAAQIAVRQARVAAGEPNAGATGVLDFTLSGPGGDKLDLKTLRGKTLVLDFWATWCGPCRAQHPLYEEVKKRFHGRPEVVFLAISTDEERSAVEPFLRQANWTQKVYFEDGLSKRLEISSIPTTLIIDRRGEVFSRMNGFVPERFVDMLSERIEQALKNP